METTLVTKNVTLKYISSPNNPELKRVIIFDNLDLDGTPYHDSKIFRKVIDLLKLDLDKVNNLCDYDPTTCLNFLFNDKIERIIKTPSFSVIYTFFPKLDENSSKFSSLYPMISIVREECTKITITDDLDFEYTLEGYDLPIKEIGSFNPLFLEEAIINYILNKEKETELLFFLFENLNLITTQLGFVIQETRLSPKLTSIEIFKGDKEIFFIPPSIKIKHVNFFNISKLDELLFSYLFGNDVEEKIRREFQMI